MSEFRYFVYYAWSIVQPGKPLIWNWHLTVLCEEAQDFTRPLWDSNAPPSDDREMVVCVPPRSLKSYIMAVCLQAWLWLRAPWITVQAISNEESLSTDDALRTLQLVQSPWYQRLLRHSHIVRGDDPDNLPMFSIDRQQAAKANFKNTMAGARVALGTGSKVTGKGADLQLLDDPYDAKDSVRGSPIQVRKKMAEVVTDYDEVLQSRLNDPGRSLRIVIMQRLDPDDLAGVLIRRGLLRGGVRVVVFPMEFDPEFPAELGGVHARDPRTKKGELLMERRWSQKVWDAIKSVVEASRHVSAQYGQRPRLPEGGLFKKALFARRFPEDPMRLRVDEVSIFVDCAFKDAATSSFVVFQAWGRRGTAWFAMLDQVRLRMDFWKMIKLLLNFRKKWHRCRRIVLEDKANGPAAVSILQRDIPGVMEWSPGTKSKYERAQVGSAPPLEAGQVYYPQDVHAPWLAGYIDRHVAFDGSGSVPDDEIDTTSMALLKWTGGGEDPLDKLRRRAAATMGQTF